MTSSGSASVQAQIAQALIDGVLLDLSDRAEGEKAIRADVIRDLLLGRWPKKVAEGAAADPRGLRLRGAVLTGRLDLDYVDIDIGLELQDCMIEDGLSAEWADLSRLNLSGSTLGRPTADQPALRGDGISVTGDLNLDNIHARSGSGGGTIRLVDGRVGGQLSLRGATLTNESGPALTADDLTVDGGAFLDVRFTATGHCQGGTVRLLGAHIGGQLVLQGAALTNKAGPALSVDRLTVDNNAFFDDGFSATGHGEDGAVRLTRVVIKGGLYLDASQIKSSSDASHRLEVDGLTYQHLSVTSWDAWLGLLRNATPSYAAQPYRQLAAITIAAGHDSETRMVLMAQRRDQLARAGLKWRDRAWGRFTGFILGYGYQPWRALIALLAVTLATVVLMLLPVADHGLYVKDQPLQRCSTSDRIVLGVDTALPLITTGVGGTCLPRDTRNGQIIAVAGVASQILGWGFATLFVAGFTGAVRKT